MKVKIVREKVATLPKIELGASTFKVIGDIVEVSILRNIKSQTQGDGSPIKSNKQSTRDRKASLGRRLLSLVDEQHRFVKGRMRSWRHKATRNSVVVEPATPELAEISGHVQRMGYTGWFSASREGARLIRETVRKRLTEIVAKAAK